MDEITFEDVLMHYQGKLQELSDQIQDIRSSVQQAHICAEEGWHGLAAAACMEKLDELSVELSRTDGDISEALVQLGAVGAAAAAPSEGE